MKPDSYDPITIALNEDIGEGDVTTEFFVPETLHVTGRIIVREKAIAAGCGAAVEVFRRVDPSVDAQIIQAGGTDVTMGDAIIEVRGLARSILKAESVVLTFLQRLCGIASLSRQLAEALGNSPRNLWDSQNT